MLNKKGGLHLGTNKIKTIRNWFVKVYFAGFCSDTLCGDGRVEKCLKHQTEEEVTIGNFLISLTSAILAIIPAILKLLLKQLKILSVRIG